MIPKPISNVLKAISPLLKDKVIKEMDFGILFSRIGSYSSYRFMRDVMGQFNIQNMECVCVLAVVCWCCICKNAQTLC